jgi:hypothetical protein
MTITTELDKTLSKGVGFEHQGKAYRIRRLGTDDLFDLLDLIQTVLGEGSASMRERITGSTFWDLQENLTTVLVMGIPRSRSRVITMLSGMLEMSIEDIRDPDKFPMGALAKALKALAEHPDVADFFALLQEIPMLQGPPGEDEATKLPNSST